MKGYQAGIQKFGEAETEVFGISVDAAPSLKRFAQDLALEFPLLSDFPNKKTAQDYGVLMAERGFTSRTTFLIDKEGKIAEIIADSKPETHFEGAAMACSRLKKK